MVRSYTNLTVADKEAIKQAQKNTCPICFRDTEELVIDHDHESGIVRAALCCRCNVGLGQFEDDWDMLLRAVCYILVYKAGLSDIRVGYRILIEDAKKRVEEWDKKIKQTADRQLLQEKRKLGLVGVVEDILTAESAGQGTSTSRDSEVSKPE